MKKVTATKVAITGELAESPLPPGIQEVLGELVGAAREGLLALSIGVGLSVVHELMEAEVDEVVGPKGRHDEGRAADRTPVVGPPSQTPVDWTRSATSRLTPRPPA